MVEFEQEFLPLDEAYQKAIEKLATLGEENTDLVRKLMDQDTIIDSLKKELTEAVEQVDLYARQIDDVTTENDRCALKYAQILEEKVNMQERIDRLVTSNNRLLGEVEGLKYAIERYAYHK